MENSLHRWVLGVLMMLGFGIIFGWLNMDPTRDFKIHSEGEDKRGQANAFVAEVSIGEFFDRFSDDYQPFSESWPAFRGVNRDNIAVSKVKLRSSFGDEAPKIVWKKELGEGHSGAAVYKGLVYLLDYDEDKRRDVLRCMALADGQELWTRSYKLPIKRNHGMSRTIPALSEDYVVTVGPKCHVMCLHRESGDLKWGLDMVKEYGTEIPFWYTGQCPLIDDGKVILAPGGKAMMIAVDCETGKVLWETPNPNGWKMSHSSVMPFIFGGRKMYVYSAIGGVVGVAANGPDAGKILWQTGAWNHSVVAPSPVCMPDGKIFLSAGYGAGSMMLQLQEENGKFLVQVLDEYKPKEGLASEQQTPIFWNGHLLGIMPKDGGEYRNQLVCVHPDNPRKILWSSGKEYRFGLGPYFIADGKLFILDDQGMLTVAEASTREFKVLSQVRLIENAHDAWAPFALADGFLICRDSKTMVCVDLNQ